jgi:hypothetical protein
MKQSKNLISALQMNASLFAAMTFMIMKTSRVICSWSHQEEKVKGTMEQGASVCSIASIELEQGRKIKPGKV